ncbi:UbiA family prenyltransferase [Yoonia sp. F2084L]|uniref:UbiA family prenyltransferase n=1 Tax=Yoonia sp. F2084L TaxID=2926419 RepID=UPI0032B25AAD
MSYKKTSFAETKRPILAVDLDGTLIRTDMLFESFWSALGCDWRTGAGAAGAALGGRARLKTYLSAAADIDVATLPYNPDVMAYIADWRASGGQAVLVTATTQGLAERIAAHLGIFDAVYGSDDVTNLKSAQKAAHLTRLYGDAGFYYMGDARADLPVWEAASGALTVDVPVSLRAQVDRLQPDAEHLSTRQRTLVPYLRALRPHQYVKNLLVFLPVLAAQQFDTMTFFAALTAFVAFCAVSSGVYLLNDLIDLKSDRNHPRKRDRPLASGSMSIAHASGLSVVLLCFGLMVAALNSLGLLTVMIGYFLMTTAYSLTFKKRAILDIAVLAGLYAGRIIAGGVATGIELSVWLLAFAVFFFFALAAVKRQAELVDMVNRDGSGASRGYNVDDLPILSMIALTAGYVSVLVLALYLTSPVVVDLYPAPGMLWGICSVLLYWFSRLVLVTHRGHMHDDPVVFALTDRVSRYCLLACVSFAVLGVFG